MLAGSALVLAVVLTTGCGTVKTTGTARSGTEQLLLTNAWDSALQKVDFRPLTGVPVYLETANITTALDKGWIISSLRQAMLQQGVLLRPKPEQAQWIVEARVGAYGTDEHNLLIGIPQTTIPATLTGVPQGTLPEIPLAKRSEQQAIAKLALFAYDRSSGQIVWNSGTLLDTANAKDVYVAGVGPIQSGSIRGGTEFVGIKLPQTSESTVRDPNSPEAARSAVPFSTPPMRQSVTTDLDGFAP
ncbi:MAG: hypothetical protein QOE66_3162 [Chloroflexota bacterium]|nr:hypothetical protein [Chloroflexota bacterium]